MYFGQFLFTKTIHFRSLLSIYYQTMIFFLFDRVHVVSFLFVWFSFDIYFLFIYVILDFIKLR